MKISTVLIVNLGILFVYMLILSIIPHATGDMPGLERMVQSMALIGLHCGALFIISIIFFMMKRNQAGRAFLLSTFVVLAIGCASCFGLAF